jgi:hypothetical protein
MEDNTSYMKISFTNLKCQCVQKLMIGEVPHLVCIKEGNTQYLEEENLVLGNVVADDLGRRDAEEVPGLPRHCPLDHENPEVVVDLNNFELSDLGLGSAHPAGHLLPLVHTPRCGSCSDGTQLPVALGTTRAMLITDKSASLNDHDA